MAACWRATETEMSTILGPSWVFGLFHSVCIAMSRSVAQPEVVVEKQKFCYRWGTPKGGGRVTLIPGYEWRGLEKSRWRGDVWDQGRQRNLDYIPGGPKNKCERFAN